MANRLNVLIGATLADNTEKSLNAELASLSKKLKKLTIDVGINGDVKKLASNIEAALSHIDVGKISIGKSLSDAGDTAARSFKVASKSLADLEKNATKAEKKVTKLDKSLQEIGSSKTITIDYGNGSKKSVTEMFDKNKKTTGKTETVIDNTEAVFKKQFEATIKQAEQTKAKVQKIYEDISDKMYDAFGEKKGQGIFYEQELNSELKKIDDITNRLKAQEVTLEDINDLQSNLNSLLAKAEKFKKTSGYEAEDIKKQIKAEEKAAKEKEKITAKRRIRDLKFNSQVMEQQRKAEEKATREKEKTDLKSYQKVLKLRSQADADKLKDMMGQKGSLSRSVDKEIKTIINKFRKIGDEWAKANGKTDGTEFIDTRKLDSYLTRLNKVKESLKETIVTEEQLTKATKELQSIQRGMDTYESTMKNKLSVEKNTKALREHWETEKAKLENEMKNNVVNMGFKFGDSFDVSKLKEMYNINEKIEQILLREDATWEQIKKEIEQVRGNVRLYNSELDVSQKQAKEQEKALKNISSTSELMNSSMGRFTQFYAFGEMARGIKTATREILSEIKTIDDAMVELKKVSDETDYTYNKFLDNAADKAKELGVSMSDYIDSVTNFKRMGVSDFGDAQIVAQNANIMQTVAESLTADQASEYLISIMSAYNYEASETMEIIDKLNNIDRCPHTEMCG